jgi:hydrogenase/urease accessory protein HupE
MTKVAFSTRPLLLALFAPLFCPAPAAAHLVTTGMGPVYDGIGHLLLTPEDLLPVLALALYAGMRGAAAGRRTMFLLPLSWLVGGLAGSAVNAAIPASVPAVSILALGGLVAADLCLPAGAVAGLAVVLGLVHGFMNGSLLREGAGTPGLIGIATMLFVLVALASAPVVSLRRPWTRIAVRVAGSWIAAIGLLLLGWTLRGRA